MTYSEAKKLKPFRSWILFAGGQYEFVGLYPKQHILEKTHLRIYDEPPSLHTDSILIKDCEIIKSEG